MNIYGFQKSTLLDYPEHLASTIFTGTCNFRCPFCHNGSLVLHTAKLPTLSEEDVFAYLKKRKSILEGVCITGGEPTIQADLIPFIQKIKALGYKVKLDTNGYRPDVLEQLIHLHLLDYIAMDIKNSPQKYAKTCGLSTIDLSLINRSIALLQESNLSFEFRTTTVRELHTLDDFLAIGDWISKDSPYYLQQYQDSPNLIQSGFHSYDSETMASFLVALRPKLPHVQLRGVDSFSSRR